MKYTPAHQDFVARMQGRLVGVPIISYMGDASGVSLRSFATDFRYSARATEQTIELMKGLVWQSVGMPIIHRAARQVREMANANNELLAAALHRWVRMNINYVPDEVLIEQGHEGRELLIAPNILLAMHPAEGDCDDFSMATAAIALSLGMRVKFVAVALERANTSRYSHIFVQVEDRVGPNGEKDWITLDCSHGPWAGWEVQGQLRRIELGL